MNRPGTALLALLGLILPLSAWTADYSPKEREREYDERRFYVAPMATYGRLGEDTFMPDEAGGIQIGFGKTITDNVALELYGFHLNDAELRRIGRDGDIDVTGYGVSGLIFPARDYLPAFGIVGYGEGVFDFDGMRGFGGTGVGDINNQDASFVDVGLGFLAPLNDFGVAIRAEYRHRTSDVDAEGGGEYRFRDNIVSVGLQIPLGAKSKPEPEPAPVPPIERDPQPMETPPVPPEPIDGDGDGIPDGVDRCPGTPIDVDVDRFGCPLDDPAPLVLEGTTFETGSATLTAEAKSQLDEVAEVLRRDPRTRVRIEGHTDSVGNAAHNLVLSRQRANAVKAYLSDNGVGPERLITRGYGETRPVAPNVRPDGSDNPRGRAANRRVELHIIRD